ncbi:hypothetical protein APHAL10511_000236 [Amanita phalloides]|nr:hypothetical protein APHAL10511_000236 [Amanita phalloides]
MPAPRLSQSGDAARFNEKKWVWVPDAKEGYLAGWVNREEEEEVAEVVMASGGEIRRVPFDALFKMNPPKFDRVEDIADLTFLNEASVVHNLRLRYGSGAIYTYSGLFLVAINPYQNLPLYSDAIIQQYRNKRRDDNPPHIFAVAERAWINMGEERENQSILITGESGAGKTESTKKVIQYLAAIATDVHLPSSSYSRSPIIGGTGSYTSLMPSSGLPRSLTGKRGHNVSPLIPEHTSHMTSKGRLGLLERQILQANPILEAFGNAQTQRNNNSSRFGKFIRILFAPDGSIAGANIDWYLLEKSRVVVRSEAERSFHVFYQLLGGADKTLQDRLLLGRNVEDYEYLNKSRREVDGVDEKEEWDTLQARLYSFYRDQRLMSDLRDQSALDTVGFAPNEQFDLFRIVAAVLHIGNITITSSRADDAVMPDPSQAERACHLLGLPVAEFIRAVLSPRVLAGREMVTQARTRQQALDELAALCKTLYEKSFGSLVDHINRALDRPSSKSTFIGVLDIAGFEIFETNGYEQLLINYTNEKLQQFFNHHMFVLEQEEYAREGIKWDYVNFGLDLQPTIDLIEASGNTIGIFSCLDEECIMPKATNVTFTDKLHSMWASTNEEPEPHPGRYKYERSRFEMGFIIQHYAGKVEYRTYGWLEKNKDPLNDNLSRVLAASSERCVSNLFAEYGDTSMARSSVLGKKRVLKKAAGDTAPFYVPLVLDQLRCNGVLEGIRIARLGYPNRLPFVEFRQRYEVLTPGIIPSGYMDGREASKRMVHALELDDGVFRIGTSKIFFKAGALAELEERRDLFLFDIFSKLQATARKFTARRQIKKILNRAVAIRTIQRNARVYGELRDWPWWQLYTKIRPLLAATRTDDELRKKEAELALVKERAERDKQEREALENLKMTLEAEKRKIEDELEAERALGLDKDALLERSKKHETELGEEITALQADLDLLDSQLEQAMKRQREGKEEYEPLRQAFDEAAEHLVRLETEQKQWTIREAELTEQLNEANDDIEALQTDREELRNVGEDLRNLVLQREEDLATARERLDIVIKELEGKLDVETRNKDLLKDKSDTLENDARRAKEHLTEMARTASDYSQMIQKKEEQMAELAKELSTLKLERDSAQKEILELQSDIETLVAELGTERDGRNQEKVSRLKLQEELDELRALMDVKTSEETRRSEAEKSREDELNDLRSQVGKLNEALAEVRRQALEGQSKLKLELEYITKEHASLQKSFGLLVQKEQTTQENCTKLQVALGGLEKTKRAFESELQSLRVRQHDHDTQLAEATKQKESLERQLTTAQAKYRDFEDITLQFQRDQETYQRQLEATKKQLESEIGKRSQIEKTFSVQKAEIVKIKDLNVKLDRDLSKALNDIKEKEWELKQMESKRDKAIVEHKHVYEAAKKMTDAQLAEAQLELQKNATYIRSLEKAKARLLNEAEDLARETERERAELRAKEKLARQQEERAARAAMEHEKERMAKVAAEMTVHRLQNDLQSSQRQVAELAEQSGIVQRSKDKLGDEFDPNQSRKQLQTEIGHLRQQLEVTRNEAVDVKRQLQKILQEEEISSTTSSAAQSKLRIIIDTYKAKEREYQERLESAEIARAKAARGEAFVRRTLSELEKAQADTGGERRALSDKLKSADLKVNELNAKIEEETRELSELNELRQRLAEELEDERANHLKDLAERDFTIDQTRKKYQAELAQLSEELQSQRDNISRLREENRKLRSDHDKLQLMYDDEAYNSGGWKKEKERMETKITDLTRAYEASTAAQTEQQSQIVALHSQVRELRSVLDDAEADRALLQKARRALQAELETIKLDHVDFSKLSTDQEFQRLQLKKQDLERSLEEQEDRVANAYDRMKKAEAHANECHIELGRIRVENSELERVNANLEKQIKELNVHIVDLETKSYANTPRSTVARRMDNRIEELAQRLNSNSDRRSPRSPDKARDSKLQLAETERQRAKLDEERKAFEAQIITLRQTMDKMQTEEASLHAAKRRAEREALDYKQKALNLERELERLHTRLEHPASVTSSPRK